MANIELLRKIGKVTYFDKNSMLFLQNDPGDDMYIALKGVFGVYINSFTDFPVRVAGIPIGKFFGEMSVIDGWPRSATIISEDESAALAIEKENFGLLLESSPEMAMGMMKTLSDRAASTTETVRQSGKTVPDLPEHLRSPKLDDPKTNLNNMIMLAQRIRELNDLLLAKTDQAPIEIKKNTDSMTLLPSGHKRFEVTDNQDNTKFLSGKKYVCPYCDNVFEDKLPLFSRLETKEKTLDQRVIYSNFDILLYTNIICPNCNYCDTYQEFSKNRATGMEVVQIKGNQFKNAESFTGYENGMKHTVDEAVLSYYLNLACLKQVPNSTLQHAKSWQRLYWLYKDNGEDDLAMNAAWEASRYYREYETANQSKLSMVDQLTINAMLGELYVAMGDVQTGRDYFVENTKIGRMTKHELVNQSLKRAGELRA